MPEGRRIEVRRVADPSVSSARPGVIAPELADFDRRIGWLVVNRVTLPILRTLSRLKPADIDSSGVEIDYIDLRPDSWIEVTPIERRGAGALLLFHGGGFVMGQPDEILPRAIAFARRIGIPVICPAYRLAPAAPFPAALDDGHAAWMRLLDRAKDMTIDPTRIVIGGYSAGGGLAAGLAQRLRDEGGVQPAAQLLIYPMLDDRTAARRALDRPRHRVWSNRNNLFAWTRYLGHSPGEDCPRYASAARNEDLAGLPPAWLGVGTCDLFLDEARVYAQRLSSAGVTTDYAEMEGAIHGFDMDENELASAFVDAQSAFVARYVR